MFRRYFALSSLVSSTSARRNVNSLEAGGDRRRERGRLTESVDSYSEIDNNCLTGFEMRIQGRREGKGAVIWGKMNWKALFNRRRRERSWQFDKDAHIWREMTTEGGRGRHWEDSEGWRLSKREEGPFNIDWNKRARLSGKNQRWYISVWYSLIIMGFITWW